MMMIMMIMMIETKKKKNMLLVKVISRQKYGILLCNRLKGNVKRFCTIPSKGKGIDAEEEFFHRVNIGDINLSFKKPQNGWRVPRNYHKNSKLDQETLSHLRWMLQKDKLGQDMFLLGPPGVCRRWLALQYCELTQREVEFVAVTRDTTESDLKQRREIINGSGVFIDQAPVRAALNGSLLILDGIEKAERNVLPTLNNLLENREIQLEDGRFLMDAKRFDQLSKEQQEMDHLVRVHPDFRVIALGIPVPPFKGKPLDPPLRSRFQSRIIEPTIDVEDLHHQLKGDENKLKYLLRMLQVFPALEKAWLEMTEMNSTRRRYGNPHFPENAYQSIARLMGEFPDENPVTFLSRAFPFFKTIPLSGDFATYQNTILSCFKSEFGLKNFEKHTVYDFKGVSDDGKFTFSSAKTDDSQVELGGNIGPYKVNTSIDKFHALPLHKKLISAMVQDHLCGRDILIIGSGGSGKSRLVEQFANLLGYKTSLFSLYQDMSARDLLQRRVTDSSGNTSWDYSPLVQAAINGDICILDGIDSVHADTITAIQRLIVDREVDLYDGKKLTCNILSSDSDEQDENLIKIHPSFRVIALGSQNVSSRGQIESGWLTADINSMFSCHHLPTLSPAEQELIARKSFNEIPNQVFARLKDFSENLGKSENEFQPLSLRQFMRICRFASAFPENAMKELKPRLENILLAQFLPNQRKEALLNKMIESEIVEDGENELLPIPVVEIEEGNDFVRVGKVKIDTHQPKHPELVPNPVFFDIPKHKDLILQLLEDIVAGEKHLLLIGNQGVGKNKIADRMLQLIKKEREYIQLHRDSTVGSLTLTPTLKDHKIVWEDSPLIRAAIHGRAIMIDEIDKAPLEVVSVLKSLVEDEEMLLADGRILLSQKRYEYVQTRDGNNQQDSTKYVPIHKGFMLIALANRPGFPFLGNNFFREIGDIFSTHVISNPDTKSELELLKSYGPNVKEHIIKSLVNSFNSLRKCVERGELLYPYSTREAVAVVKHLNEYPQDGVVETLYNVLGFDSYDNDSMELIARLFRENNIPLSGYDNKTRVVPLELKVDIGKTNDLPPPLPTEGWKS